MASEPVPIDDERYEPRDEVMHRTRALLVDRRSFAAVVVNVSAHGLMLRSDAPVAPGEWIKVPLPIVGEIHAAVRWALGGRIGCEISQAITPALYPALLAAMRA